MSLNRRLASRIRFDRYRKEPRTHGVDGEGRAGQEPRRSRHRTLVVLYRELWHQLRGHRLTLVWALLGLSVATLLKLVPPAATKLVIDQVLLGRPVPTYVSHWITVPTSPRMQLVLLVGLVLAVTIVGSVVGLWSRWQATRTTKQLQVEMRRKAFEHAVRLPLHRIYELKAGGAASLLREDAGGVGELVFSMLYNPWRAIVQLLGGIVVLAWVDWRFLLGSLVLVPALYGTDRVWNRRLRPLFRDIRKQRQDIDAKATEAFGGMRVVRAFGRQRREAARFVGENDYMVRQELYAWWSSRTIEVLWDLLLPSASGALLFYGGIQVLDGRLSLGDLMMFLVYLAMLLEPLAVLATSVTQLQNNLSGFDRVLDLLAESREMTSRPGSLGVRKEAVAGRVTLDDVSFAYPNSDNLVLSRITLDVRPGEVIALVGRSGSGKTTLCNLIARFYDPTSGVVRLDGTDLRDIEVEAFRRLLGFVEQDVFLFDGSVAENIAYADRWATRVQIESAARVAHADEFIAALPDGYETIIGERGVRLSGGQRQRLAIARAVLADPKIFILDEATSNLDTESERLIQVALAALMRGRTTFMIAHRLSTIRGADRILVLQDGAIAELGTHDELMARSGLYRDMVHLQRMDQA